MQWCAFIEKKNPAQKAHTYEATSGIPLVDCNGSVCRLPSSIHASCGCAEFVTQI